MSSRSDGEEALASIKEEAYDVIFVDYNIPKVDVLYRIALGFKILPLIPNRRDLLKAVELRHDCVHRNGYDKEGTRHTVFTVPFVKSTAELIRQFVQAVEKATLNRERGDTGATSK